jgi:hypothetical protein
MWNDRIMNAKQHRKCPSTGLEKQEYHKIHSVAGGGFNSGLTEYEAEFLTAAL